MKIEILDGTVFQGIDLDTIIKYMKLADFSCPRNVKDYMFLVQNRVKSLTGKDISTKTVAIFFNDLARLKLLKIIEEVDE